MTSLQKSSLHYWTFMNATVDGGFPSQVPLMWIFSFFVSPKSLVNKDSSDLRHHGRCQCDVTVLIATHTMHRKNTSQGHSHNVDETDSGRIYQMYPANTCKQVRDIRRDQWHVSSPPFGKMAAISRTIFSYAFSWTKGFVIWLKFHRSLFLRVNLTITQHWFI